ncbi:hypothetical protein GUITHDRAFT_110226 [Guillardia theta CCMP2712]|uniref:Tetratricopeptide SHNi-TPR domain-containing protein n=1 Tax=Guillardia theta (strain CCMP2712) TaxID=905079 RepID=L1J5K5_GUITC|nr:hypothetical protein GUITHDRAFT_110226 [Guillardia theta CCMP2712]EKX43771.1 hypothetical protein GUITHDRAFT_110226 [Guillardia theta CCMP2712]|eukprot:XP_005830751.1 hypothetical protein GUITHDRAFT_110226 [Guillardia theta CCMP2712]
MFSEAADLFSAALQMKVEQHGEMSIRCAENYFLYGSALALEAEQDDGENLFGPKVPKHIALKGEEEEEEEGEEGDEEDGEEKHEEGNEENREGKIEEAGAGVEEQAKVEEEVQEQVTEGFKEAQADGAIASVDNATTRSNVTEDEETNDPRTQAWEILETARLILQKELLSPTPGDAPVTPAERKSLNLLLADVHLRLGDLNLWNENFEESTWDYSQENFVGPERQEVDGGSDSGGDEEWTMTWEQAEYITGISMLYKGDKQAGLELLREASEVCKVLSSKAEKDGKNYTNILQEIEGNTTLSEMMEKLKEDEQDPEPFNEDEFEVESRKRTATEIEDGDTADLETPRKKTVQELS